MESPRVLIIGTDPRLGDELKNAFAPLDDVRPVLQTAGDFRSGVESARSWRPNVCMLEMTGDMGQLRSTVEEILLGSPETAVVGVFRPSLFSVEQSEGAVLIDAVRAGVKDFLRRPVSSGDLSVLLARLRKNENREPTKLGRVTAFISSKGGVGKSTLAVNAAAGLAKKHRGRVLLVDCSLQIGVCAAMLDLHPRTTLSDAVRQRSRLDETLIRELAVPHTSGLDLLAAPSDPVEAVEIDDEIISRVLTLARRAYDFVIVDTLPLLDRIGMAVLDLSDSAYIVVENVVPTLLGAAKFVELLSGLNYDAARQRVVINRYTSGAGNPRPADVAERLGRTVDHIIPLDRRWIAAANTGRPLVETAGRFSKSARAMRKLVAEIEAGAVRTADSAENLAASADVTAPEAASLRESQPARGGELSHRLRLSPAAEGDAP